MAGSGIFFFFNDTATTEIYTLSLHDALPICGRGREVVPQLARRHVMREVEVEAQVGDLPRVGDRSEEHTSELQSRRDLVCRLLLEKKKKKADPRITIKKNSTQTPP